MKILFIILSALILCTSCYRLPEEGEVSVIPVTNNPSMTRQQPSLMPGVNY